jgi:hypothetical protein
MDGEFQHYLPEGRSMEFTIPVGGTLLLHRASHPFHKGV